MHVHSIIVGWRLPYVIGDPEPQHGEIVIFKDNKERGVLLIKRIIGIAVDVIDIKDGFVYVNSEKSFE